MKKKWSKVKKGDEVIVDGQRVTVKKIAGGVATLAGNGVFLRLPAEGKVEVEEPETPEERAAREKIEAKLHARNKLAAAEARTMRANAKAKAERERVQASWSKPADKAEKVIERELGATLVGVQGAPDEPFVCPPLPMDPSTIKAHLLIFHEYDSEDRSHAALTELHEWMHSKDGDAIPVPHEHRDTRPHQP